MDFSHSERSLALQQRMAEFLDERIYPAESTYAAERMAAGDAHAVPEVVEELKREGRDRGLWNLFLPGESSEGAGLTNLEYAPVAELTGRSPQLAPEAINCSAPDTGNMELLHLFGTPAQKEQWLRPLLDGRIRSCFGMTEPDVASSDATNMMTTIVKDGDSYVINGRKWWSSGGGDPRCRLAIVMGVTDPDADRHRRHSMILVPFDSPGVTVERHLSVFGYDDQPGHPEVRYDQVRVPADHLLGEPGSGFALAQARLGPGRIHHCMRAIGMSERALDLMIDRVNHRVAFGGPLADRGVLREWIALSRMEIDQARLLVLNAAWKIDEVGNKGARREIAAIKVVAARLACQVIDRAMQAFGAAGVSADFPLSSLYAAARILRIVDGPDEVHLRAIGREEVKRRADRPAPIAMVAA